MVMRYEIVWPMSCHIEFRLGSDLFQNLAYMLRAEAEAGCGGWWPWGGGVLQPKCGASLEALLAHRASWLSSNLRLGGQRPSGSPCTPPLLPRGLPQQGRNCTSLCDHLSKEKAGKLIFVTAIVAVCESGGQRRGGLRCGGMACT